MGTKLYVCRHGETEWNRAKKLQGQLNSPLTTLGKQQAEILAERATSWGINGVWSSHLGRAVQTADICMRRLNVSHQTDPRLCERSFGHWQGKEMASLPDYLAFREVRYTQPELMPNNGGESASLVAQRLKQALTDIAQYSESNALVISHGDAMACVATSFSHAKKINNCSGYVLKFNNGTLHWDGWLVE